MRSAPRFECCRPQIRSFPSGKAYAHGADCKRAPNQRVSSSQADAIAELRRVGVQRAETARAGVETGVVLALDGDRWRRRNALPTDCDWHEGVEYTTSGICAGPRCTAYLVAHLDSADRGPR